MGEVGLDEIPFAMDKKGSLSTLILTGAGPSLDNGDATLILAVIWCDYYSVGTT